MVVLLHRCRKARLMPCRVLTHFAREGYFWAPVYDRFTDGFCDMRTARARSTRSRGVVRAAWRGIERTNMQIRARPDKRRNSRAG